MNFFTQGFHRDDPLSFVISSSGRCALLSTIPGHLPDQALRSKLAVELWIQALAAAFEIQTFAAFPAVTGFMFLTQGRRFSVGVVSAFHMKGLSDCIMSEKDPVSQETILRLERSPVASLFWI